MWIPQELAGFCHVSTRPETMIEERERERERKEGGSSESLPGGRAERGHAMRRKSHVLEKNALVLHSSAYYCKTILDDNSSSALIILGFVIMSPLIVVAMAVYCSLARRLHLFLCFQPYARAVYKGVKWRWYEEGGLCSCAKEWSTQVKAWV
ncbi:transmembrane protein 88B isoform X2 [Mauremys reevesii]|uniref:transmembrane protein 88B isoform X2 n=1 Tax=Mauremys reevesii TaxID=260615 RepID=UPI00193F393D|nr:transmembrane protein 88B isoform X2 [Mauremys reevesii]